MSTVRKPTIIVTVATAAVAVLAIAASGCTKETRAQQTITTQTRGVTVGGEGKATGAPDLAQVTLGVSVLRSTVADARDQAATSLDAILKSMKANGLADKDLQTQNLNISPEYDYANNQQTIRGFRVTNNVSAKIRDINKTSKVVDDAVAAGGDATQLQGISFTIDNPKDLQKQAREAAIADAKEKAQTLAKSGGVSLGEAITINEGGGVQPVPVQTLADRDRSVGAAGAPTPVQPGELDVTINVTVTWAIN